MTDEKINIGTFTATLQQLYRLGVICKTVVDIGCADGHFSLTHFPFFPGALLINIDANPEYQPSLKAIADVMGGMYLTVAVTDTVGEIELTVAAHPYWDSVRQEGDPYWKGMNDLHTGKRCVKSVTLDSLHQQLPLVPPYLLKLDVQGAEALVLRGGGDFLRETDIVICEADIKDFHLLHALLDGAGFDLFDLTQIERRQNGTLGWFYPVYVNRRRELAVQPIWAPDHNARIIAMQQQRRADILKMNEHLLGFYRANRI